MGRQEQSTVGMQRPRRRGGRIACRQCRQAKIRCELSTGGDLPCSRCRRLEQDCAIDTEFKRVNKRARLDELEKEVRQLRSSVSNFPSSTLGHLHDRSPARHSLDLESTIRSPEPLSRTGNVLRDAVSADLEHPCHLPADSPTPATPRSLGHINLSSQQIDSLFHLFFSKFHKHALLLDPNLSPDDYYSRSSLLFWVIIYTSSRQYADELSFLTGLTSPVKQLLWAEISSPPHTWSIVQSILLLCMWPFPTSSLSTDTTPMLVSIAQTIAMQLGLHQPEAIQDFSRTKRRLSLLEISEAVRTWSICYITAQNMSNTFGQSPLSSDSSNWMIDRICDQESDYAIPEAMKQQLLIYRFSARVSDCMSKHLPSTSGAARSPERMPLLALLEQEFQDLSRALAKRLTAENEILLNAMGIQLYVFYLFHSGGSVARKMGLLTAFDTATALIGKLQELDATSNLMKYCPAPYFRATTLAAMFILKIQDSSYAGLLDVEGGKRAFNIAIALLRRASLEDNDLPGRTSKILAQLWTGKGCSKQTSEEPSLQLRTRLAASLLHDSLWTWRVRFGGQGSAPDTPPPLTAGAPGNQARTDSLEEDQLPFVPDETGLDGLVFGDVFDAEMLSLLPFSLDGDLLWQPSV